MCRFLLKCTAAIVLLSGGVFIAPGHAQESWQEKLKEVEKQFGNINTAENTSASKVEVSSLLSVNKIHPGTQFQVAVILDIVDRWHINAHVPSFDYLIGTELKLAPPEGVQVIGIRYPESKKLKFEFAEEALDVYEGRSPVFVVLQVSRDLATGAHQINGSLRVQACDDQVCLAPSTVEVALPFEVVAYGQPVAPINAEIFSSVSGTAGMPPRGTVNEITNLFESKGAVLAFLGIFVIGLALNLTPCVYPMLSVKKIFGVVMTGAALFYVGLALFPKLTVYVVPLTLFPGGIYLGFLQRSGKENKTLLKIQWALGAIAVLLAAVSLRALQKPGVDWESYAPQRLEQARLANKPVIMDFYADWCIPCLELDRLTFTDSKVIAATEDFVKLKVDLTHFNSSESEALRQQFNISGVPTIVFLGRDGEEVPGTRVVGYLPPEKFIERMHPALSLAEAHSTDAASKP